MIDPAKYSQRAREFYSASYVPEVTRELRRRLESAGKDPAPGVTASILEALTAGDPRLFGLAQVGATENLLDIGCGAGADLARAALARGGTERLAGLDISAELLALTRELLERGGHGAVRLIEGDVFSVPMDAGPFDVVLANAVLHMIPEKVPALRRILKLLRPRGRMMVNDLVIVGRLPDFFQEKPLHVDGHLIWGGLLSQAEYTLSFFEAGFEAVELIEQKPCLPPERILEALRNRPDIGPREIEELAPKLRRLHFSAITFRARPSLHRETVAMSCCDRPLALAHIPSVHLAHSAYLEKTARKGVLNTIQCPRCRRRLASPLPYLVVDDAQRKLLHVFPEETRDDHESLTSQVQFFHQEWERETGITGYRSEIVFGPVELAGALGRLLDIP